MHSAARPSEQDGELPVIDAEMGTVRAAGKRELWLRLLDMLAADLPISLEKLEAAFANRQFDEVASIAHRLRGSAVYCGTPAFERAVADLGLACRQAPPLADEIRERLELLRKEAGRLLQAIQAGNFSKE